jgi:hypothetical protein
VLKRRGIQVMALVVPPTDTAGIEKLGLDPAEDANEAHERDAVRFGSAAGVSQELLARLAGADLWLAERLALALPRRSSPT